MDPGAGRARGAGVSKARYEVRCTGRDGAELVVGVTDDPTGGSLIGVVEQHPVWTLPRVVVVGSGQQQLPADWPFPKGDALPVANLNKRQWIKITKLARANAVTAQRVVKYGGGALTLAQFTEAMFPVLYQVPIDWKCSGESPPDELKANYDKLCALVACQLGLLVQTSTGYQLPEAFPC